jgi:hypothetical protein
MYTKGIRVKYFKYKEVDFEEMMIILRIELGWSQKKLLEVDELNQKNSNPFNSWGKRKKRRTQRVIKGFDEKKIWLIGGSVKA